MESKELKQAARYGVRWDMRGTGTAMQRTLDAANLAEPIPAIGASGGSSPFDQLEPWKSIRECNVINNAIVAYKGDDGFTRDGTNGDVMIYFPAIYVKTFIEDGRYLNIQIASGEAEGFTRIADRSFFCIGKYKTVLDGEMHVSKTGEKPCVSITRAAFRDAAREKGEHWSQQDAAARFALAILYLVEFADFDSQAKIGRGLTDAYWEDEAAATGETDTMEYHTGAANRSDGKTQIVYRGVESPWGNVWEFIDGININDGKPYICTNPEKFADDTKEGYTEASYKCPTTWGYQKEYGIDKNIPWLLLPVGIDRDADDNNMEYYWGRKGWRLAFAGGNWNNGSDAGLLAWSANCDSAFAYAHVGSRLLFMP